GFYFSTADPKDWTSPQNDDLWQDNVKTLFDPCPAGWRVSRSGTGNLSPWSAFTLDNNVWNGDGIGSSGGRTWTSPYISGGDAWYPANGYRLPGTAGLKVVGDSYFVWYSGTQGTEGLDSGFYFNRLYPSADDPRAYGFSVRCVRE
ncbi:MAG: hypothetical protein LIO68_06180, partial [Rikenellaceae bacterium]|nr:hypothetical protein [Rikenellaceae bacterium]